MKKQNPQFRWHLTIKEKAQIYRLTLKRVPQATIARLLHIGAPSVSKAQREMGLPTRLAMVIPEQRIMELFEKGWGGVRIAKQLRIAVSAVYKVAHKHGFRRQDGSGSPEPKGDVAGFIEALKRRENYVIRLARKYGVAICRAQRIAHEVLGTYRFRPGASKPALSSDYPQRHFDTAFAGQQREEALARIVKGAIAAGFGGKLPEDLVGLSRLIAASINVCILIFKRARPEVFFDRADQTKLSDYFMPRFLETIATLRTAQNGLVN
jgi:hypothetical protein